MSRSVPGAEDLRLVAAADTFFVASVHPECGLDASHRGGPRASSGSSPTSACCPGNGMFNTLGNVAVEPRVGLAFVDFGTGRVTELRGRAEIVWDREDPDGRTGGTERFWRFAPDAVRTITPPLAGTWEQLDPSPFTPP